MKKPMKTVKELISYMKGKGIKFSIINEIDAEEHLNKHNNYFKLTSYRKNYTKYTSGINKGKYENLEFAYLIELARIDTEIRTLLLNMALDIEHFIKVALIKAVEDALASGTGEDGYKVLNGYLNADDITDNAERIKTVASRNTQYYHKFSQNVKNPYCNGLIDKYAEDMPIWTYVELCSFGDIKNLIEYYAKKTGWNIGIDINTLDRVRQLRNACAHGNCIINDLKPNQYVHKGVSLTPPYISQFIYTAGLKTNIVSKKMSNQRINQIIHLLYAYDKIVKTDNTRNKRLRELHDLIDVRIMNNSKFFSANQLLTSTYSFFKDICSTLK